ncbi:helix-turn-helix domain-containing protein [Nocardia fusca]|uniref:helix-turn-helix domain-containing protein n=1 Tax=Nocardia fusca TaxID=941183 RepID=UPI0037CBBD2D
MAGIGKPGRPRKPRYVSISDAAFYCSVSTDTIRRAIAHGTITGYRFGGKLIRIDLHEIDDHMKQLVGGSNR